MNTTYSITLHFRDIFTTGSTVSVANSKKVFPMTILKTYRKKSMTFDDILNFIKIIDIYKFNNLGS